MKTTRLILCVLVLSALSGCAYFVDMFSDDLLDQVDRAMVRICELPESDRLPIREKIFERYNVDTSPACPHLKGKT